MGKDLYAMVLLLKKKTCKGSELNRSTIRVQAEDIRQICSAHRPFRSFRQRHPCASDSYVRIVSEEHGL
jgi:hypothetical protein